MTLCPREAQVRTREPDNRGRECFRWGQVFFAIIQHGGPAEKSPILP